MSFHFFRSGAEDSIPVPIPTLGLELIIKLPPQASESALTVLETTNASGFGPPLHRHRETEIFRVLEGRYLYEVDGRRFQAAAGELITVPGGVAHAFINITEKPARQLVMMLPGMDAKGFFIGLAQVLEHGSPGLQAMNAFGKPWNVEFLGPPLSLTP